VLESLELTCIQLRAIPDMYICSLSRLTSLAMRAYGCEVLESLSRLSRLEVLRWSYMAICPSYIGLLPSLRELDLSGSGILMELPESLGSLTRLQVLNLSGCSCLSCTC
jgi:Leucine-rich repeat (LRR) protein